MCGNLDIGHGKRVIPEYGYLEDGLHHLMPGAHGFPAIGPTAMVIIIGSPATGHTTNNSLKIY